MANEKKKDQYEAKFRHVRLTGGEAPGPQITEAVGDEGQVTSIEVYGEEVMDFSIEAAESGSGTTTETFTLAGDSQYSVGSFSEPLFKFGTNHAISVANLSAVSSDTVIGINIRMDVRKG